MTRFFLVFGFSFLVLGSYAAIAADEPFRPEAGKFPPPIALGDNRVGWIESEIEDWLLERIAARDTALAKPVPRPRGRQLKPGWRPA